MPGWRRYRKESFDQRGVLLPSTKCGRYLHRQMVLLYTTNDKKEILYVYAVGCSSGAGLSYVAEESVAVPLFITNHHGGRFRSGLERVTGYLMLRSFCCRACNAMLDIFSTIFHNSLGLETRGISVANYLNAYPAHHSQWYRLGISASMFIDTLGSVSRIFPYQTAWYGVRITNLGRCLVVYVHVNRYIDLTATGECCGR